MGKRREFSHLSYEQRQQIEQMLVTGHNGMEIAAQLNVSESTVYREIKRGTLDNHYSASFSQNRYDSTKVLKSGAIPKLVKNKQLAEYISYKILDEGMSPGRIVTELEIEGIEGGDIVTVNTIYKAIDDGNIPGVTRDTIRSRIIKMSSEGHLIIPRWVRDKYNFKPGDRFEVSEESEQRIVFTKIADGGGTDEKNQSP